VCRPPTEERSEFVSQLWEKHLVGGVILSEYSTFLARDAEAAFEARADIATIILCVAAIETHLRHEFGLTRKDKVSFRQLIEESDLALQVQTDFNRLRKYRNRWVHVDDPWDDQTLQSESDKIGTELDEMARLAMKSLIIALCAFQWL
jgi:thymidylate synthase